MIIQNNNINPIEQIGNTQPINDESNIHIQSHNPNEQMKNTQTVNEVNSLNNQIQNNIPIERIGNTQQINNCNFQDYIIFENKNIYKLNKNHHIYIHIDRKLMNYKKCSLPN